MPSLLHTYRIYIFFIFMWVIQYFQLVEFSHIESQRLKIIQFECQYIDIFFSFRLCTFPIIIQIIIFEFLNLILATCIHIEFNVEGIKRDLKRKKRSKLNEMECRHIVRCQRDDSNGSYQIHVTIKYIWYTIYQLIVNVDVVNAIIV